MTNALHPAALRRLLDDYGLRPSRALGQNFLADPNTARRITRLAGVAGGRQVLEIGPGLGSLTVALADAVGPTGRLVALELDRHLLAPLAEVTAGLRQVEVRQGDALTVDFDTLLGELPGPWAVVANLPYNIATPLVARILTGFPRLDPVVVMVQKEVADRLRAKPGERVSGAISVKVSYYATARRLAVVGPDVFMPRPRVDSAVVAFTRHPEPPVDIPSTETLFALAQAGFAQRRKTLRRALQPLVGERAADLLSAAGIAPSARAESLALEQWAALARVAGDLG